MMLSYNHLDYNSIIKDQRHYSGLRRALKVAAGPSKTYDETKETYRKHWLQEIKNQSTE
jgi:hypothetical protein